MPKHEVARLGVIRQRTPSRRRDVFEKLDSRPTRGAQRGDAEPRAENLIEMFLLCAVVLGVACDNHAERAAIKLKALVRVTDDDGRVVDAEKQRSAGVPWRAGALQRRTRRAEALRRPLPLRI